MTAGAAATDLRAEPCQQSAGNQEGPIRVECDLIGGPACLVDQRSDHEAGDEEQPPRRVAAGRRKQAGEDSADAGKASVHRQQKGRGGANQDSAGESRIGGEVLHRLLLRPGPGPAIARRTKLR